MYVVHYVKLLRRKVQNLKELLMLIYRVPFKLLEVSLQLLVQMFSSTAGDLRSILNGVTCAKRCKF